MDIGSLTTHKHESLNQTTYEHVYVYYTYSVKKPK